MNSTRLGYFFRLCIVATSTFMVLIPILLLPQEQYKVLFFLLLPYNFASAIIFTNPLGGKYFLKDGLYFKSKNYLRFVFFSVACGVVYLLSIYYFVFYELVTFIQIVVALIFLFACIANFEISNLNVFLDKAVISIRLADLVLYCLISGTCLLLIFLICLKNFNITYASLAFIFHPIFLSLWVQYKSKIESASYDATSELGLPIWKNITRWNWNAVKPELFFSYIFVPSLVNVPGPFFQILRLQIAITKFIMQVSPRSIEVLSLSRQYTQILTLIMVSCVVGFGVGFLYFKHAALTVALSSILAGFVIINRIFEFIGSKTQWILTTLYIVGAVLIYWY